MKSAFSKLIAGLGVSFLLIAFLTGCASTRYTEYDQKDRQALRTLAGGVSGALIAGNAGGAILGAFIVDMVHLATVRYDDVQLENGDEAARRYQDRYQAGKGKGDKKASRGAGDKKAEKIREEKKAEQATGKDKKAEIPQEDKKAQREKDIEKRVEERMRELEAQSDEKRQKGRNLQKRAEEKEREKKAEEVKEVPKKAEQPLDQDKKADLPGEEKKAEKPLDLEKKAEQPLDQDKKADLPGEEKKAEKPREEKKAAQESEPGKKAERDEDRRVQLFIEGSSVLSQNVKVGSLTEANVQYTVLAPSDERDIVITETRMLWSVEKKIELARREIIRTPGTHRSTIKFKIPEDVPRGYYILYTTVAAGDRTRTAKSVMNITF